MISKDVAGALGRLLGEKHVKAARLRKGAGLSLGGGRARRIGPGVNKGIPQQAPAAASANWEKARSMFGRMGIPPQQAPAAASANWEKARSMFGRMGIPPQQAPAAAPAAAPAVAPKAAASRGGMKKKAIGIGTGLLLASFAPQIYKGLKGAWGGLGRGLGSWLGLKQRAGAGAGADAGADAGKGGPLWGAHTRSMFARAGINPAAYQQRHGAMGDVLGGMRMRGAQSKNWQAIANAMLL